MSDVVTPLLQWLNANPQWAGFATFIISAAESVAIIGTLVPGSITMTAIGTLAGAGVIPLYETLIWAILGAVVGDGISYWLGYYFKYRLRTTWPFRQNPILLEKGEMFVNKYGIMSVFIGRFVGPVRAIVPLVAGMLGMRPLQFTIANIASAIGWAPVYMLPGILIGAASLELPPDIALHAILVLFLMFLFIVLCLWFIYKLIWLIRNQIEQSLTNLWEALRKSRYFHITTVVLKHHDPRQHHGQLTLAFYFLLTTLMLALLACYVKIVGPQNIFVNDALLHLFRGIRSEHLDTIMINISLLGQKEVILPVIAVLFGWLLLIKRSRAAFHVLALGVLAAASVYGLKHLIQSPRPWGIFNSPETFSLPSGHSTLAATVYMGVAFMIAGTMRPSRRWLVYTPAVLVALLVGISRIYLGAHWFTDVLAAWLLSTAVLILVILSYHRQAEKPIKLLGTTVVCLVVLCITYSYYHHKHFDQLAKDYMLTQKPIADIRMYQWWNVREKNPILRLSLFGLPSQRINIEWAGNLEKIRTTLTKLGWDEPPARDWISTVHRLTDIQSGEYLPMISPQYRDKRPVLIMAKRIDREKKLLVIRLWESNYMIQDPRTPLWVGTLGIVPRSFSWLFRHNNNNNIKTDAALLIPIQSTQWEWKLTSAEGAKKERRNRSYPVLLIRERK